MIRRRSSPVVPPPQFARPLERIAEFAEAVGRITEPVPDRLSWDGGDWTLRPFAHARMHAGNVTIRGLRAWFRGHVIRLSPAGTTDGIFAAWSADEDAIEVRNDRYGFYPLYYFSNGQEFAVSPFVLTLLALGASRELDDEGLAVFLRLGCFLGEHTPFKQIRALPPGCHLSWSRGSLRVSGGILNATHRDIDRSAAIDGYIDLFAQAIKRRAPQGAVVLPLSGGRDSRHILLELLRQGHAPHLCVTMHHFPPRPSTDLEIASQVVKVADVPQLVVTQPRSFAQAEVVKNLWTNLCTDDHAKYLALARTLTSIGAGTVYDGIAGDMLSGVRDEERLELSFAGRFEELSEKVLSEDREIMLAAALSPGAYGRFGRALARNGLVEELQKHAHQPNPVGSFNFWNRVRRSFALIPYRIYSGAPVVFAPYVDHDLFDFVTSLPGSMLVGRQFHIDAIYRAFPKYAHLQFAAGWGQGPPREDRWFNRRFAGETMVPLLLRRASMFMRRDYLVPRLAKRLWDGRTWVNGGYYGTYPQLILYLLQLERIVTDQAGPIPGLRGVSEVIGHRA